VSEEGTLVRGFRTSTEYTREFNMNIFDMQRYYATMNENNFEIIQISPDGNCQFGSLSMCLYGDPMHTDLVRQKVVEFMLVSPHEFQSLMINFPSSESNHNNNASINDGIRFLGTKEYEKQCQYLSKNRNWGNAYSLHAARLLYSIRIYIHSCDVVPERLTPADREMTNEIRLSYENREHYNAVFVKQMDNDDQKENNNNYGILEDRYKQNPGSYEDIIIAQKAEENHINLLEQKSIILDQLPDVLPGVDGINADILGAGDDYHEQQEQEQEQEQQQQQQQQQQQLLLIDNNAVSPMKCINTITGPIIMPHSSNFIIPLMIYIEPQFQINAAYGSLEHNCLLIQEIHLDHAIKDTIGFINECIPIELSFKIKRMILPAISNKAEEDIIMEEKQSLLSEISKHTKFKIHVTQHGFWIFKYETKRVDKIMNQCFINKGIEKNQQMWFSLDNDKNLVLLFQSFLQQCTDVNEIYKLLLTQSSASKSKNEIAYKEKILHYIEQRLSTADNDDDEFLTNNDLQDLLAEFAKDKKTESPYWKLFWTASQESFKSIINIHNRNDATHQFRYSKKDFKIIPPINVTSIPKAKDKTAPLVNQISLQQLEEYKSRQK